MSERHTLACPKCSTVDPHTDFAKSNVKPERPWDEHEGTSRMLSFDPAGMPTLKREMPSAEFNRDGDMVFRSNSHQRRVFREMTATRQRYREEDQARADRRRATDTDIADAAKAIRAHEQGRSR
jgi:hypothetical protein